MIVFILVATLFAAITTGVIFARYYLHSFLAPNAPLEDASILVVEGWMDDVSLKGVLPVFAQGNYSIAVTIGGPLTIGAYLSPYKTLAELSAATLIAFGFDPNSLVALPSQKSTRDRTAKTGVTFRKWLANHYPGVTCVNLYSYGVHARRSWILYQRALGPSIRVGVISPPPTVYDPKYWWRSSDGFKRVLVECISLAYTLIAN